MILHLFAIAWRSFRRNFRYSMINLAGLTLAIAASLMIFLYVHYEWTYDTVHANAEGIYRINGTWHSKTDATSQTYARIGYIIGDVFKNDFPEVDKFVRFQRSWQTRVSTPDSDDVHMEQVYSAEPAIFEMFTLPLAAGNPAQVLADKSSIVISQRAALKYFGTTDVVGERLRLFLGDTLDFQVTGVLEDSPETTQLKIDLLTLLQPPANPGDEWFEYRYYTYFTLKPGIDIADVKAKIAHFTKPYVKGYEDEIGFEQEHSIVAFSDIHLSSNLPGELETNSNGTYVLIFFVSGCFILAMGCINFMNLSTARVLRRAREIGIKKVIGAKRSQLIRQFYGEAFFVTMTATVCALAVAHTMLPLLTGFAEKELGLNKGPLVWIMAGGILVIATLLSGSYPALFLSALKPVDSIKGESTKVRGATVRKGLVVLQFTISIGMLAGTFIIHDHLKFLRNKELGFTGEQVVIVQRPSQELKQRLLNESHIKAIAFSNRVPGQSIGGRTIITGWNENDRQVVLGQLAVDPDFISLYELELISGRAFDVNIPSDQKEAFIVNEAALELLGYTPEQAIGQKLWLGEWGNRKGQIIGVLKDFHFRGVNEKIEPFAMFLHDGGFFNASIKINSENMQQTLARIESTFKAVTPGVAFNYSFLDEQFDHQYQSEDRLQAIFSIFTGIAVVIGCLGLYGLVLFMTEQRMREVSIRKVLGATAVNIVLLLTLDFLKLVAIAFLIALPLAYIAMSEWLSTFPYREEVSPLMLISIGAVVAAIAILTVAQQAITAARSNPARSLKAD